MRKLSLIALIAATSLPLGGAIAGEGAGDPFPYHVAGVTTDYAKMVRRSPDQDAFQYRSPAQAVKSVDLSAMAPQTGSEQSVQTANSLPQHASEGTQSYARTHSLQQYWAARGVTTVKTQVAQPTTTPATTARNG